MIPQQGAFVNGSFGRKTPSGRPGAARRKKIADFLKKSLTIPLRYGIFYLQLVKPNRK